MYLTYFGLSEPPFSITPDPRFVFMSSRHEDALAHLHYGIEQQGSGGFVQLTGEVGTGKTTLCRLLLERQPDGCRVALILNPLLGPIDLLEAICEELAISIEGAEGNAKQLTDRLNRYLLDAHAKGEKVVVIFDEAQALSPAALEQVRLLTNLETSTRKLMQIILLGQPELRQLLGRPDLRQLAQRVTARFHLEPLNSTETRQYVGHRLVIAGATRNPFSDSALRTLHRLSQGVPRVINTIAERALLGAYSQSKQLITPRMVRQAAREVSARPPSRWRVQWPGVLLPLGLGAVIAAVALGLYALVVAPPANVNAEPPAVSATEISVAEPIQDLAVAEPESAPSQPQPGNRATEPPIVATGAAVLPASSQRESLTLSPTAELSLAAQPSAPAEQAMPLLPLPVAWTELLRRRSIPTTSLPLGGCAWRVTDSLRCLAKRGGVEQLIALRRPVLVVMAEGYAVVGPAVGGRLFWNGMDHEVPVNRFADRWSGEYWDVFDVPGYIERVLREGDRGPGVVWVKERAAKMEPAYEGDVQDPYFGPSLRRWTERYQVVNNLKTDGLVGPETLQQLSRLSNHVDNS